MIRDARKICKIAVICNKYKNTVNDFIESWDKKNSNWLELIDKKLRNVPKFESSLRNLLERNCHLNNKDVLKKSLKLVPKT